MRATAVSFLIYSKKEKTILNSFNQQFPKLSLSLFSFLFSVRLRFCQPDISFKSVVCFSWSCWMDGSLCVGSGGAAPKVNAADTEVSIRFHERCTPTSKLRCNILCGLYFTCTEFFPPKVSEAAAAAAAADLSPSLPHHFSDGSNVRSQAKSRQGHPSDSFIKSFSSLSSMAHLSHTTTSSNASCRLQLLRNSCYCLSSTLNSIFDLNPIKPPHCTAPLTSFLHLHHLCYSSYPVSGTFPRITGPIRLSLSWRNTAN